MAGKTEKAKGRIKRSAGALTGNKRLEREGMMDEAKGSVKEAAARTKREIKRSHRANEG